MMIHTKSESDMTSLEASSPRSPKRAAYFVQSPSHDDKSSSMQPTPVFNSPTESPSHPSYGRHSRTSSASRFSGNWRKRAAPGHEKGWPECDVIEEEGSYDDLYGDKHSTRRCQILIGFVSFVVIFSVFCLILWGASRPYRARISLKSMRVHNFYYGEGSDTTGVPTKLITVNCTVRMTVYNPATFFGIHITSAPVTLMYSEIAVAEGELKSYYQPRKSQRTLIVNLIGVKVPLYGAGASLVHSDIDKEIPMTLDFELRSVGHVVGKLVKSIHKRHVSCSLVIDAHITKPFKFEEDSCSFE